MNLTITLKNVLALLTIFSIGGMTVLLFSQIYRHLKQPLEPGINSILRSFFLLLILVSFLFALDLAFAQVLINVFLSSILVLESGIPAGKKRNTTRGDTFLISLVLLGLSLVGLFLAFDAGTLVYLAWTGLLAAGLLLFHSVRLKKAEAISGPIQERHLASSRSNILGFLLMFVSQFFFIYLLVFIGEDVPTGIYVAGWIALHGAIFALSLASFLYREEALDHQLVSSREAQGRLSFLTEHDNVTGLYNRHAFFELLSELCRNQGTSSVRSSVFVLDLDHFASVNSLLGTDNADHILQMVAERLTIHNGDAESVFRIGGDEFALVNQSAGSELASALLAEEILKLFARPFRLGEHEIYLTTSIGISFVEGSPSTAEVMANVMEALESAKEDRNTYRFFQRDWSHASRDKVRYLNALRHALTAHELSLAFQPQMDGKGNLVGAEALLRWNSASLGEVPPATFIPIAEESGLIITLGEWVIEEACKELASWLAQGIRIPLAVNLSARQLRDKKLERLLVGTVRKYAIPPELLHLEITETSVFSDKAASMDIIWNLRNQGFHFCIDDFGTGYASLTYLKTLPVHTVKIDKSFIGGLPRDPQDTAVVNAVLGIARGLGLRVVAEGVEELHQADYLMDQNCGVLQGFYYSKPLASPDFLHFVKTTNQLDS